VLKGVGINTGEPPILGVLELCSLGMGCVADPKIHDLSARVTTSNLIVLQQKVWGALRPTPLGWGVTDLLKTSPYPIPICVTTSNLVVLW